MREIKPYGLISSSNLNLLLELKETSIPAKKAIKESSMMMSQREFIMS